MLGWIYLPIVLESSKCKEYNNNYKINSLFTLNTFFAFLLTLLKLNVLEMIDAKPQTEVAEV